MPSTVKAKSSSFLALWKVPFSLEDRSNDRSRSSHRGARPV